MIWPSIETAAPLAASRTGEHNAAGVLAWISAHFRTLGFEQLQRTNQALEFSLPRSLWSKAPLGLGAFARIRVHVAGDAGTMWLRVRGWYRLLELLWLIPAAVLAGVALGAPTIWGPLTIALFWAVLLLVLHRALFAMSIRRLASAIGRRPD